MTTPNVAVKQSSLVEDIIDVFYMPAAVFARRRGGFGVAMLIYIAVMVGILYAARPVFQPMVDRQIAKQIEQMQANPNMSAEQRASAEAGIKKFVDSPFAILGPAVFLPIALFITGLALWICGKLFGSVATYGQLMMVTTLSAFPRLVLSVLLTGFAIATGREMSNQYALTLSPAAFLPADASPLTSALLSRLDVGTLWQTALLGIGLAIVGKIPRNQAYIAAGLVWFLGGVVVVLGALREMA